MPVTARRAPALVSVAVTGALLAACTGTPPAAHTRSAAKLATPAASSLLPSSDRLVDRPVTSSGCGRRPGIQPGTTGLLRVAVPPAAAAGARQRTLWLRVPAHYDPRRPVPLVLVFHGGGGTGLAMQQTSGLSGLADARGFLAAYPQGLVQGHGKGGTGWDASGPADPYADRIDDGLFVSDLLNALQARYCVDPRRIAATGLSNGGSMTGYLACVLAGRIAAFVPVEGVFFQIPGGCHPARPAAILDVHVLTDPIAPYAGVPSRGSPDYYALAIPVWLRGWALRDRCRPVPSVTSPSVELSVAAWRDCPDGASVLGYRLASGGHSWFRALGAQAGDDILLGFLAAHPLAGPPRGWAPGQPVPAPALAAPPIAVGSVRVFRLPDRSCEPFDITAGPGGMWFTEFGTDKIGRISPSGQVTEYRVPTPGAGPYQIAAGPGGTVWFTEFYQAKAGRVTGAGAVSEIRLPSPSVGGNGIAAGPHQLIVTADGDGYLDQIAPGGQVSRIKLPAAGGVPFAVAASPGGTVSVSKLTGFFEYSRVLLALRAGHAPVTLTLPSPLSNIDALAAGAAGTVWFTDFGTGAIGELSPGARPRLFSDPSAYAGLTDITRGPDGAMWYTEQAGLVGRITTAGTITQLALPGAGTNPDGIAAGAGRTIWVAETGAGAIARITLR